MSKHTGGTWGVYHFGHCNYIRTDDHQTEGMGSVIAIIPDDYDKQMGVRHDTTANARLIAAAPELLEALEIFQKAFNHALCRLRDNGYFVYSSALNDAEEKACKAIAKAKGE